MYRTEILDEEVLDSLWMGDLTAEELARNLSTEVEKIEWILEELRRKRVVNRYRGQYWTLTKGALRQLGSRTKDIPAWGISSPEERMD